MRRENGMRQACFLVVKTRHETVQANSLAAICYMIYSDFRSKKQWQRKNTTSVKSHTTYHRRQTVRTRNIVTAFKRWNRPNNTLNFAQDYA
jgi:hypothetical protein